MGNRSAKPHQNQMSKKTHTKHNKGTEMLQFPRKKPPSTKPLLFLFGDPNSSSTSYLRFILHYKPLTLRFIPTDSPDFKVRFDTEDDPVSGTLEAVLEHVDAKLPLPPLLKRERKKMLEWLGRDDDQTAPFWEVVKMGVLQHRSMKLHLEKMLEMGTVKKGMEMEIGKLAKRYGSLLEVMLEHAQMEERVILPILHSKQPGACRCVNEEHGRDLPLMNGIKEYIKSVGVLNAGTSTYKEAFQILSTRLKALKDNCNQHFEEEERNMFPLMETADLNRDEESKIINQCIDVMQATHSHLFPFFIEGLLPHEAMEYLDLIGSYIDKEKLASLLRLLIE